MKRAALYAWCLLPCFAPATMQALASDERRVALETIEIGVPFDVRTLDIRPQVDHQSSTGYRIPKSLSEASSALDSMLSASELESLLAANGIDSDFLARNRRIFAIGEWLYRNWALGDATSPVGERLRAMGFTTPGWTARALFEHVYEAHKGDQKNVVSRMRRFAFSEAQDSMQPLSSPPRDCAAADAVVKSADIWLGERDAWPHGRILQWVDCTDGSIRAYLWEREWFIPEPILNRIIEESRKASRAR